MHHRCENLFRFRHSAGKYGIPRQHNTYLRYAKSYAAGSGATTLNEIPPVPNGPGRQLPSQNHRHRQSGSPAAPVTVRV